MIKKALIIAALFLLSSAPILLFAQTYRKPVPNLPVTLDPKNFVDAYSGLVISQIYDRLFEHDELLRLQKNLVSENESDESGQTWKLILRKDVKFHNGKEFTAEDVVYTLKRLLKGESLRYHQLSIIRGAKDYHNGKAKDVEGIKIVSPYELKITLERPFPPFLSVLASSNTEMLPKDLAGKSEKEFFKNPIGTGPFKFVESKPSEFVHLAANDKYFGGTPFLKDLYYIKTSRDEAISGFNKGEYEDLEWFYPLPKELRRSYRTIISPAADTAIIVFNTLRLPLSNQHVRRAIAMAMDKKEIINQCFSQAQLAKGYIPPGVLGYYPEMQDLPYNLDLARSEIRKSGLSKTALSTKMPLLKPDNHPCRETFKYIFERSMQDIGLNIDVQYVSMKKLMEIYKKGDYYILSFIESSDFPEAIFMLNTFHSKNPDNFTKATIPELDKLIEEVFVAPDRYKRIELYRRIQEKILEEALIVSLYYDTYTGVFQDHVRGVKFMPLISYLSPMKYIYYEGEKSKR